ncbi:MAG: hypothetical protein K6F25_02635, partial [Bacteroidales bacterium]|nr:hypothetical protein [Bacteroidales bacterium]
MKKIFLLPVIICSGLLAGCGGGQYVQPELGTRTVQVIEKNGYRFKDLDKNGKLDPYEDWRLTPQKRAADLLGRMSIDEKLGFMLISQINMKSPATSELNEEDAVTRRNIFTGLELGEEKVNASGTTKGILERNLRHFILRANAPARTMAEWANNV